MTVKQSSDLRVKTHPYHFGNLLAEVLRKKGLKQKDLSQLTGFSTPYISQILTEKRNPDLTKLEIICNALNIKLSFFLMKSLMDEQVKEGKHAELVEKIKPLLYELEKLIYPERHIKTETENRIEWEQWIDGGLPQDYFGSQFEKTHEKAE